MNLAAGLIASRVVHYAALMILFGAALFPVYAYWRARPAPAEAGAFMAWQRRVLAAAAIAALASGVSWLGFVTATMSGNPAAMFDPDTLLLVIQVTGFGQVWAVRLVVMASLIALLLTQRESKTGAFVVLVLAAILLSTLALTGHAGAHSGAGRVTHIVADAVHLLAAGAWLGGLLALAYVLMQERAHATAEAILLRFSGMGYVAVAAIVASGLVNSWFLVGSPRGLTTTPYGQVLMVKLALFLGMAAIAGANRFWIVPNLARAPASPVWLTRMRRHVAMEQALGFAVLAAVSVLGTLAPAAE